VSVRVKFNGQVLEAHDLAVFQRCYLWHVRAGQF
jgi:hypothetical protein